MTNKYFKSGSSNTALTRALQNGQSAAKPGFDWPDTAGVRAKIMEELDEVTAAESTGSTVAVEEEIGDLLLAVVSLARHLGVDPETALNGANRKFEQRFQRMQDILHAEEKSIETLAIEELEAFEDRRYLS